MLAPGEIFAADYEVQRPLAEGGMGAVYEVLQRSTGKKRALKVMLGELVRDPEHRRRFEQEARIGSRIASEHVVEVTAAGVDDKSNRPYIVMELLDGMDLAKLVRTRGPIPIREAHAILEQLSHAMIAAHRAGIVHRDLKPENVFVAQSQRAGSSTTVKVLDFGIAKLTETARTNRTAAMGTPLWMAPEQADRGEITPAADVWSMGLISFFLITGVHFWRCTDAGEPTLTALLRDLLIDPIPSARERASNRGVAHLLPADFERVLARCVVRDPGERFRDAGEWWAALDPILRGAEPRASPVARTAPVVPTVTPALATDAIAHAPTQLDTTKPPRSGVGFVLAGVAIILVFGATAVGLQLFRRHRREDPIVNVVTNSSGAQAPVSTPSPSPSLSPTTKPKRAVTKPTVGGDKEPRVLSGAIDEQFIVGALKYNVRLFDDCYRSALERKPNMHGSLVLRVEVSAGGVTRDVTLQPESDVTDPKIVSCMGDVFRRHAWGPPSRAPVVIEFPFELLLP